VLGGYPVTHINARKIGVREDNRETGPDGPANAAEGPSPTLDPGEDATLEQLQTIRKLIREGMSEKLAREEVLGKGWVEP
jgi:hypothetical protein